MQQNESFLSFFLNMNYFTQYTYQLDYPITILPYIDEEANNREELRWSQRLSADTN